MEKKIKNDTSLPHVMFVSWRWITLIHYLVEMPKILSKGLSKKGLISVSDLLNSLEAVVLSVPRLGVLVGYVLFIIVERPLSMAQPIFCNMLIKLSS